MAAEIFSAMNLLGDLAKIILATSEEFSDVEQEWFLYFSILLIVDCLLS